MALKSDFYNEIFKKEQMWIDLINEELLNSIYCNLTLKPFYMQKKQELEQEYNATNNPIIGEIIPIIDNILQKISLFNEQYRSSKQVNINEMLPLFLTSQMNNTAEKTEENVTIRHY